MKSTPKKKSSRRYVPATATKIVRAIQPATVNRLERRRLVKTVLGAVVGGVIAGPLGLAAGAVITALGTAKTERRTTKQIGPAKKISARPQPAVIDVSPKPRVTTRRRRPAIDIYPPIP
jgi:hypothetical protein